MLKIVKMPEKVEPMEDIVKSEEFKFSVKIVQLTFLPLGVWPLKSGYYNFPLRIIMISIVALLLMYLIIPALLYFFIKLKNLMPRLKMLAAITFSILNMVKYVLLLRNNRQFDIYLNHIAIDWKSAKKQQDRDMMMSKAQTSRILMSICIGSMLLSGTLFCSAMTLTKPYVTVGNKTFFSLPVDSYYIFYEPYQRTYFDLTYLGQCIGGLIVYLINAGICNLTILGILHISGQCAITNSMIRTLAENFNLQYVEEVMEHHWRSLKFALKMQDFLDEIFVIEFVNCTFHLCLAGYYMILDYQNKDFGSFVTFSAFVVSFTFNIFIFCYLGEHLTEQYESVYNEVVMMKWYRLPWKQIRNYHFILLFMQPPVHLSAGKLIDFSLPSFTTVMKASATYLNMLRTVTL